MAPEGELGSCRHCDHWPVHASARWCPACGGIAPFTRAPAPKSRSWIGAIIGLLVILAAVGVAWYFGGR